MYYGGFEQIAGDARRRWFRGQAGIVATWQRVGIRGHLNGRAASVATWQLDGTSSDWKGLE